MKKRGLTPKQERFVGEYLCDLNATQAAIRAGYAPRSADVTGARLLGNARVAAAIQAGRAKLAETAELSAGRVLQELARIATFDVRKLFDADGSLKRPGDLDDATAAAVAAIDVVEMAGGMAAGEGGEVAHVPMFAKKVKAWDKVSALNLYAKILGMLVEKHEHTGKGGGPIKTQDVPMTREDFLAALQSVSQKV